MVFGWDWWWGCGRLSACQVEAGRGAREGRVSAGRGWGEGERGSFLWGERGGHGSRRRWFDGLMVNGGRRWRNAGRRTAGRRKRGRSWDRISAKQAAGIGDRVARLTQLVYIPGMWESTSPQSAAGEGLGADGQRSVRRLRGMGACWAVGCGAECGECRVRPPL